LSPRLWDQTTIVVRGKEKECPILPRGCKKGIRRTEREKGRYSLKDYAGTRKDGGKRRSLVYSDEKEPLGRFFSKTGGGKVSTGNTVAAEGFEGESAGPEARAEASSRKKGRGGGGGRLGERGREKKQRWLTLRSDQKKKQRKKSIISKVEQKKAWSQIGWKGGGDG